MAEIVVNKIKVSYCKNEITGLKPRSKYAFLIVCSDIKGDKITSNISYKITKLQGIQITNAHNLATSADRKKHGG